MKIMIKILLVAMLGFLSACNDNEGEIEPEVPDSTRYVYIYFNLPYMSTSSEVDAQTMHNYIADGYTIHLSGAVSEEYETISNVNLNSSLRIETTGDVVISVEHPNYDATGISKEAYYSVDEVLLATGTKGELSLDLEFIQGYVLVTTSDQFDLNKYRLAINELSAEFNTTYYMTEELVISKISYDGMSVEIGNINVIGDGYVYYAFEDDNGNLNFM